MIGAAASHGFNVNKDTHTHIHNGMIVGSSKNAALTPISGRSVKRK